MAKDTVWIKIENEYQKSNNTYSLAQHRMDYLKKKDWVAPEDIELFNKGVTPEKERGWWDEDKRKQAFIDKLKNPILKNRVISLNRYGNWLPCTIRYRVL